MLLPATHYKLSSEGGSAYGGPPRSRRGQVMVELIVALSILTVGFIGVVELLSKSIVTNRNIADQYTASYLAGEGIEIVKNLIDANIIANIVPGPPDNCDWGAPQSGISPGRYQVNYDEASSPPTCPGKVLSPAGGSPNPLKYNAATHLYGGTGDVSPFVRTITILVPAPDKIYVRSLVTYGGNSVVVEDIFTNWRP